MMQGDSSPSLTAPEILERMVQADNDRLAALAGYSGVRHYRFENKKTGKTAEMTVRMSCGSDGVKTFEVVSESGSGFVRSHIIGKMIEAETESSQKGERKESRIIPENYEFRLIGMEDLDGRSSYVLEIDPKKPTKFAIRGRIWVDAQDFAIARIEGQPAKNPVFLDSQRQGGATVRTHRPILAAGSEPLGSTGENLRRDRSRHRVFRLQD